MDKIAKLKSGAKGLIAGGILGAGAGVSAAHQIKKNSHNARTLKGWDTRRRNSMIKKAELDKIDEAKAVLRSVGHNIDTPTKMVKTYAMRTLISKAKSILKGTGHKGVTHHGS